MSWRERRAQGLHLGKDVFLAQQAKQNWETQLSLMSTKEWNAEKHEDTSQERCSSANGLGSQSGLSKRTKQKWVSKRSQTCSPGSGWCMWLRKKVYCWECIGLTACISAGSIGVAAAIRACGRSGAGSGPAVLIPTLVRIISGGTAAEPQTRFSTTGTTTPLSPSQSCHPRPDPPITTSVRMNTPAFRFSQMLSINFAL